MKTNAFDNLHLSPTLPDSPDAKERYDEHHRAESLGLPSLPEAGDHLYRWGGLVQHL